MASAQPAFVTLQNMVGFQAIAQIELHFNCMLNTALNNGFVGGTFSLRIAKPVLEGAFDSLIANAAVTFLNESAGPGEFAASNIRRVK